MNLNEKLIKKDKYGPEYVLEIYDSSIGMEGFLVIDNTVLGPGKGGRSLWAGPNDDLEKCSGWNPFRRSQGGNYLAGRGRSSQKTIRPKFRQSDKTISYQEIYRRPGCEHGRKGNEVRS